MAMVLRALLVSLVMTSAARAQPCSELPVLYIVQDKSGSMAGTPTGGTASAATPSKWSIASQVVPQMAAQFANRFRYGVMMYPGASTNFSCTTGVAVQAVPSTSSQVASAYAAYGPGGGTPTAAALQQARAALTAFATTAPRYVLLITDGLPNCNLALLTHQPHQALLGLIDLAAQPLSRKFMPIMLRTTDHLNPNKIRL